MSAFVHDMAHIRALVNAGLSFPEYGPLRWGTRALTDEERERAYQSGTLQGPDAIEIANATRRELTRATAGMVGAMLWAENQRSVNFRYGEYEIEQVYEHGDDARAYTPVEILLAIDSYEYQSCETPDWEDSEAYRFCDALRHAAIRRLPGYDKADTWRIRDEAGDFQ